MIDVFFLLSHVGVSVETVVDPPTIIYRIEHSLFTLDGRQHPMTLVVMTAVGVDDGDGGDDDDGRW
jgi:hypothetical protein